jgi:hypothetical protein
MRTPVSALLLKICAAAWPVTQTSGLRPQKPERSAIVARAAMKACTMVTRGASAPLCGSAGIIQTTTDSQKATRIRKNMTLSLAVHA